MSKLFSLDVTDVAWAPEDRYLASVGLDSKVLIWCGYTLGAHYFRFLHNVSMTALQSVCISSINTKDSSRAYVGIQSGNFLLLSLMTGLSKFGALAIGP